MSDFFTRLLRQQEWNTGLAGDEDQLAMWTAFKHECVDHGADAGDVGDVAAYALAALIAGAIEDGSLKMKIMMLIGKPDLGETVPDDHSDCSELPWFDRMDSVEFNTSGYCDSFDSDGNKFHYWHGGGNTSRATFGTNGQLKKLGDLVVRFEGLTYGPTGWLDVQQAEEDSQMAEWREEERSKAAAKPPLDPDGEH